MKSSASLLLIVFTGLFSKSFSQQATRELAPVRGHYKQLQQFSPKPTPSNGELDKKKFITDNETIARRLSLKPFYLYNVNPDAFNLPDAPANSSAQTRAELNYLRALQETRTQEDIRASLFYADVYYNLRVKPGDSTYQLYRRNLFHIGRSIGSWFNPQTLPVTTDFMARVWQDASYFIWYFKFKYARIRPYSIEPTLKNMQDTDWAAYPSGHAANSYINAYIYSELAPEFTDFFIKDAYDMAHSREIIGVHYPTDSECSRIFARQFVTMLFKNEKFLEDFQRVKAEWALNARESLK